MRKPHSQRKPHQLAAPRFCGCVRYCCSAKCRICTMVDESVCCVVDLCASSIDIRCERKRNMPNSSLKTCRPCRLSSAVRPKDTPSVRWLQLCQYKSCVSRCETRAKSVHSWSHMYKIRSKNFKMYIWVKTECTVIRSERCVDLIVEKMPCKWRS